MRVLVVDDDPAIVEILDLMLSEYQVIKAYSGREAITLYKLFKPGLVIMDIVMPDISGIHATKEILRINPSAKIIGITAFVKHKGKEMLEAGAVDIITKPFKKKELIKKIEEYRK